jgi:hypothetical protein
MSQYLLMSESLDYLAHWHEHNPPEVPREHEKAGVVISYDEMLTSSSLPDVEQAEVISGEVLLAVSTLDSDYIAGSDEEEKATVEAVAKNTTSKSAKRS